MLSAWISKTQGTFNVSITDSELEVEAELMIDDTGLLQVRHMKMDFNFGDLEMHFEKLGFLGKMFQVRRISALQPALERTSPSIIFPQGIINKVGVFVFETIKPTVWAEVESKLREVLNSEARSIPHEFPNSINPIDQTLAYVR